MMLNNYAGLKGKDEDLWLEIHKFQSEDYQHHLDLVKLVHVKEVDGFLFDSH